MLDTLKSHAAATSAGAATRAGTATRRWLARGLGAAVIALAAFLLYRTLRNYSVGEIAASIAAIPSSRFALALAFAAASYLCLTGFDWLATRYAQQQIPYRYVALTSFCSLSLGHNIGFAALSSGAIRYRFYSRIGLSVGDIAKIILFCALTVGLGLALLAGAALLWRPDMAGEITGLPKGVITGLAVTCLAVPAIYVVLAATVRRALHIRNWSIELPRLPLALAQVVIGPVNFACVAACLYHVLAGVNEVSYFAVATVYVIGNVTTLMTHVPGGLGVIETVVQVLMPQANSIGALIAFRAIYFLIPLCIGGTMFAITELVLRRSGASRR
jgi:glycosyltransferase 2 family protein